LKTKLRLIALLLIAAAPAQGSPVIVTVNGIRDGQGSIRVAVCPRANFLQPLCPYVARAPAHAGATVVTIKDVPPGAYAVQAFHDANDNGVLDRNWLGMPEEGMGFSHDPPMRYGPPDFDAASFTLGAAGATVAIVLRYFD